ncbi:SRP19-domain-containing protein [Poronia punctata]|nr:SRP19-domain-containing protein [Poronia punctata]
MSHARIEEVSDSEDENNNNFSDPSEGDIEEFTESDILLAKPKTSTTTSTSKKPAVEPPLLPQSQQTQTPPQPGLQPNDIRDYQMLYPIYFDSSRTRAQGRRVPSSLAVKNPLAREIANACAALRLSPVFEAHRIHPKDWANPGRVRVALKEAKARGHPITNKHHLYILVAKYLAEHPTTENSPSLRHGARGSAGAGAGMGMGMNDVYADGKPWPKPAVPRGWKMNDLLPAYSAAMTGGGVSENAFKDMMREMQGQGGAPGGLPGMDPGMMSMLQNMGMGGGGGGGGGMPAIGGGGGESSGKKAKKGKR